jgi:hypothetical protein
MKEMPRRGQLKQSRTLSGVTRAAATVVFAVVAIHTVAVSPARAEAKEPSPPLPQWPSFSDALDADNRESQRIVIVYAEPPPPSVLTSNSAVSAPLPQAVVAGVFMLGGNWVLTRMWKKRKI